MLIPVRDSSQIFQARQTAVALAGKLAFSEHQTGKVAIVATEIASNLIKHARSGELSASIVDERGERAVEILAIDSGPGIADIEKSLADGYSSTGTAGTGLGAVKRLSDRFEIFSRPGVGTVLMARLARNRARTGWRGLEVGAAMAPFPGEEVCGDGWTFARRRTGGVLVLADGLGHGREAARAAAESVRIGNGSDDAPPVEIANRIHRALAPTRGAAVAVAEIDLERKRIAYVGIGNISGSVIADGVCRAMVSHTGTAGLIARCIAEFHYPFADPPIVVLHSDGISARWNLSDFPGLQHQHPSIVAGVLYRDFKRGRDDATVAVVREVV